MAKLDFNPKNLPASKVLPSGISPNVWEQLERTETFETFPEEDVFLANETLGDNIKQAIAAAEAWLAQTDISSSESEQ